jgi:hypothetical protein
MNRTTLRRVGDGSYVTPDGRFTVTPWRNCTGMRPGSAGRREWMVTDTSGARPFRIFTGMMVDSRAVSTLTDARDIITWTMNAEETP